MVYRYTFTLSKTDEMVYLSHLDLMRLLTRAFRRSGAALALTQGFSPRPRLRVARAVKLGMSFEAEAGEVELKDLMAPRELAARLDAALPLGIRVDDLVLATQQ
ncbi:MAG: TIGR03936 family radical SAM-associated protein [Deltaproteobacteria bacterium]